MSEENVELSLGALDAYNRRDAEALIAVSDPDVVWSAAFERETEGGTYRGHAGVREGIRALSEFSEESYAELSEWHDFGDRVLGRGRFRLRFAVASSSIRRRRPFTRGATKSSSKCGAGSATPKPSKPPGCGSRRCRSLLLPMQWQPVCETTPPSENEGGRPNCGSALEASAAPSGPADAGSRDQKCRICGGDRQMTRNRPYLLRPDKEEVPGSSPGSPTRPQAGFQRLRGTRSSSPPMPCPAQKRWLPPGIS